MAVVNDHVVLESTQYPGQHVGVRPDGSVKAPTETGTGAHAQFRPIVHMQVRFSDVMYCHITHRGVGVSQL